MKILKIVLIAASLVLATATLAEESVRTEIKIAITDGGGEDAVRLNLDGEALGFDLHGMQEGETHSVVDESGRSILITREAEGFKFDVDGKTIELPLFGENHGAMWAVNGDMEDIDVHVMGDRNILTMDGNDGITIISGQPIDDVTREGIKSLLTSSGHAEEVNFVDGSEKHAGVHRVMVIKKEYSE